MTIVHISINGGGAPDDAPTVRRAAFRVSFGRRPPGGNSGDRAPEFFRAQSQREAAERTSMSEHQLKTAVRVAAVPSVLFDAAVDSDEPPTVTTLADMGRKTDPDRVSTATRLAIVLMSCVLRLSQFGRAQGAADRDRLAVCNRAFCYPTLNNDIFCTDPELS